MGDIYSDGDPGIEWAEANAANDDGQAVIDAEQAAEAERQAEADKAVRRLDAEVDAAQKAAYAACCTLNDLCGRLYDVELAESARGGEIAKSLHDALTALVDARKGTASRLKEITDAERDAELVRLRAENTRLRAQLATTAEADSHEPCALCKLRAERGIEPPPGGCTCQARRESDLSKLTITDTEMTSDQTRHTAAVVPGAVIEGGPTAWSVSWLPGRLLLRNQAITAMTIAESVDSALDPYAAERVWPHIAGWAAELGLSDVDAVAMASLPPVDIQDGTVTGGE